MPTREPREVTESFRIERVLKSSRSGIVFRALDPGTNGPVAIKLIPPPAPAVTAACHARFVALAELLTLLQPSGVPTLHDFGFTPDGSAFLVMELVDGTRLDRIEGLSPARVVGTALSVIDTLAALANKGIQHGNLSPDNVLVGQGDRTWVVGLGTAALRPSGSLARVVLDGEAAEFAAPERFDEAGGGATDWRGDLYSLALTVCSLLKAEVAPADAPAPGVRLPFDVAKGLRDPNVLRTALEQSLRRSPNERPPSFDVLREAFRRALGAPAAADSPTPKPEGAPAEPSARAQREAIRPTPSGAPSTTAHTPPAGGDVAKPGPASPDPLSSSGLEWEEPEGAPAWLQESAPAFVLEKPEPRPIEPPPEPERDVREDTNPVPLKRKAELPLKPRPDLAPIAPTVGAPHPLPTPAIAAAAAPAPLIAPPPPPALSTPPTPPAASPAAAAPPAVEVAEPAEARAQSSSPPVVLSAPAAAPAAQPATAAPPPTGPGPERPLDSTPPTGSYELRAQSQQDAPAAQEPPQVVAPLPAAAAEPTAEVLAAGEPSSEEAPAKPPETKRAPTPAGQGHRWLVAVLAAAAVVIVGSVGVFIGMQVLRSRQAVPATPPPLPTRARPTAAPQPGVSQAVLASLLAAEEGASAGDLTAAQTALDSITGDDELALGPGDLGRLTRVRAAMNRLRLDGILGDLRTGLASGNLKLLRDAVRRVTREDEAALSSDPDTGQTLDEARRAVNLFSLATKAQQAANDGLLLQHASALLELVPKSTLAAELREKAASGLEREADALMQRGRFEEAQDRIETLGRYWSARPGIAQRLERLRNGQAAEQKLAAVLAQAEQAERDRQPDRGVELLRSVAPPPYYEERFRQLRGRLQALVQELDANPPALEIPPMLKLEYQKNKPFVLTVRITDDHGVKTATLFARIKGADHYQELPLIRGPDSEWRGEITAAMHQNKAVELYVVATDQSGHAGQAGSAEQPIQLKKKWSLFGM